MPLVTLTEVLADAETGGYAVAAFNDVNGLYARTMVEAAEEVRSPLILMIAEVHFKYVDLEDIAPYLVHVCRRAKVPVALMLDHGASLDTVVRAIRAGFTAVMFDGSRLAFENNITETCSIVKIARAVGVSVEGEFGHVAGHEGGAVGVLPGGIQQLTDPDQAAEFCERTGVDCLAVSVGTKHGFYTDEPKLDFDRLAAIRTKVTVPLAIHGGSGLTDDDFRGLVAHGAAKINYYTGMAATAARAARAALTDNPSLLHLPDVMLKVNDAVREEISHVLTVFGGSGRVE